MELWKNCYKQREINRKSTIKLLLARSNLDSIESQIVETLINKEISHEDFITISNEEKNYHELKKALEEWIVKEVMHKKLIWLKKVKK